MNILLFGPQGSGKGTQAELISKKLNLFHLSTGDALRSEIKNDTDLGRKVKNIINVGSLVSDDIINDIVLSKYNIISSDKTYNGVIFDGYPRSYDQWLFVQKHFKIDAALEIHIEDEESVHRISSRRMCTTCGKNYNLMWLKPAIDGHCDIDNAALITRDDDKPVEIRKRLAIYHSQTAPLKIEYKKVGILHVIDGSKSIEIVNNDVMHVLNSLK